MKTNKRKSVGQIYTNKSISKAKIIQTQKKIQKVDLNNTKKFMTPQRSKSVGKIITMPITTKSQSKSKLSENVKNVPFQNKQKIITPTLQTSQSTLKKVQIKIQSTPKKSVSIQTTDLLPQYQPTPQPEKPKKQIKQKKQMNQKNYTSFNNPNKNTYKNMRNQFTKTAKIYTNTNLIFTPAFNKIDDSNYKIAQNKDKGNKYKKPVLNIADQVFDKKCDIYKHTVKKEKNQIVEKELKQKVQDFLSVSNVVQKTQKNTEQSVVEQKTQKKKQMNVLQEKNQKNEKNEKRKQNINKLQEQYMRNLLKYQSTKKTLDQLKFMCKSNKQNI